MNALYNCKRCKTARRVEYPEKRGFGRKISGRTDSTGKWREPGVWITAIGGGRPTVYVGDVEMGICPTCHKMMEYGEIKAVVSAHVCDARCMGSRGRICECSCGGANHGSAWAA
jgi:hypothetical protein